MGVSRRSAANAASRSGVGSAQNAGSDRSIDSTGGSGGSCKAIVLRGSRSAGRVPARWRIGSPVVVWIPGGGTDAARHLHPRRHDAHRRRLGRRDRRPLRGRSRPADGDGVLPRRRCARPRRGGARRREGGLSHPARRRPPRVARAAPAQDPRRGAQLRRPHRRVGDSAPGVPDLLQQAGHLGERPLRPDPPAARVARARLRGGARLRDRAPLPSPPAPSRPGGDRRLHGPRRRDGARLAAAHADLDDGQVLRHALPDGSLDRHPRRARRPALARDPHLGERRAAPGRQYQVARPRLLRSRRAPLDRLHPRAGRRRLDRHAGRSGHLDEAPAPARRRRRGAGGDRPDRPAREPGNRGAGGHEDAVVSRFRWILFACGLAGLACATAPPPATETGRLFLWEIAPADGHGVGVHVMGSVHLSDDEIHFDPAVEAALAEAHTLVLEVDPDELDPTRMAKLTAERGFFSDGRTLADVVSPRTLELLEKRLASYGVPMEGFLGMEPWLVGMTIQMIDLQRKGFDPDQGVEMSLARSASGAGKEILGLETAEAQISTLDRLPLATQELMLIDVLDEDSDGAGSLELLLDAWRKGDSARLEAEVFAGLGHDPALDPFFQAIYFDRNRHMADGIAEIVDRGRPALVVVGAAHVVGTQGIPALLAAEGYSVRQVPKTPR